MIDRILLEGSANREGLTELLRVGLGWPVDPEYAFEAEPEIADGVAGGARVDVHSLVPVGGDDDPLIILAEFKQDYLRRDLRELVRSLRKHVRETARFKDYSGYGDTVFIVATPDYNDVRFVLFEEQGRRQPRIRSFGWTRQTIGRTVLTHNLERLRWEERAEWSSAWDVEGLTKDFYDAFIRDFDAILSMTAHPGGDKTKQLYVLQLLNRLLFISYIERMGWLKTPDGDTDYLASLWRRFNDRTGYQEIEDKTIIQATFNGLLGLLFFDGLGTDTGIGQGHRFYPLLGEVPYLNGGLFEQEAGLDVSGVEVDDAAFGLLLNEKTGLFRRFNFTVTESTPLDEEVAVDPEMLGKIFERIVIGEERHRTGSYYTPRVVVEFMVNETLKGYLVERGLPSEKAKLLVDEDKVESESASFLPSELQNSIDWLGQVRAVDPACGSGAYLLLLLQRLFELTDRLEVFQNKKRSPDPHHFYATKLRLLQRCVYGVDISEIAVRIAKLRLWLSLVVENKGVKPEPLPNFDFLIMCGDSLASPIKHDQRTLDYPHAEISEYTELKRRFFNPKESEERPSRAQMAQKRAVVAAKFESDLASDTLRHITKNPFDWEIDFAEVFDPNPPPEERPLGLSGFDIALANPPFVNSGELLRHLGKQHKDALVRTYEQVGSGTADYLVYFFARGLEILRPHGQFAFISSNKWLKATYGLKLRSFMARKSAVQHLVDFGDLPVFEGVIAYPMITLAVKDLEPGGTSYTQVTSLKAPFPEMPAVVDELGHWLPADALGKDGTWNLEAARDAERLAKMREGGVSLGEYVNGKVYRGLLTGLNEAFVIDGTKRRELIAQDPNSAEIIKPIASGRDIKRWIAEDKDKWVILTKIGTDMTRYPAVMNHLERFKDRLVPRADQGDYWWELRACAYYDLFERDAVCYLVFQVGTRFAKKPAGLYLNNAVFCIGESFDKFLMGVLNSSLGWQEICRVCPQIQNGRQLLWDQFKNVTIPRADDASRAEVESFVQQILDRKSEGGAAVDVSDLESEIDRRIEFLYFGEAGSYDEAIAIAAGEIRTFLRRPVEDVTLELKETLWYDVKLGNVHGDRVMDVAKAICAMLNRDGGTILIGVSDDKRILGIDRDLERLGTPDKFQRKLSESFGVKLRPDPSDLVSVRFIPIGDKLIARVDVRRDEGAVFALNDKVYVRRDGSSVELVGSDLTSWWSRRQKGDA